MSRQAQSTFEFDRFRVDPNQRVLFRDGRPLSLPPKVFQTLLMLVESPGKVVPKEDFFARVWNDTVVEESNLTWNIHTIRKSLGETPKRRFIVTVPKVGFRFEETVRVVAPVPSGAPTPQAVRTAPVAEEVPSIGVLPFLNIGGNPENEYLSDGIAEEIIDVLARIKGLHVAVRTSSFAFRGRDVDTRTIADVLGVTFLIEGSVRKFDRRIRVSIRLFDVNKGYIWTDVFESQEGNLLELQDEIVRSVAHNLRLSLGVGGLPAIARGPRLNSEAHNYQLLGRYFWNQRTANSFEKAIQNYEAALRLEPRYALAHAGIADVFNALGMYRMMAPQQAFSRARQSAQQALEIEPDLAEAHTAMGIVSNWLDWNWSAGEAHFQYALSVKPDYATGHQWYALSLPIVGRIQEAVDEMCKAVQLEPLSLGINATLSWIYFIARDGDRAIQQALITLERDQQFSLAKYYLGLAYVQKGLFQEAISVISELRSEARDATVTVSALGFAYGAAGERKAAEGCLRDLMRLSKTQYVSAYDLALVQGALGEVDKAVETLERAVEERGWLNCLSVLPLFDKLRETPRFTQLLRKIQSQVQSGQ